MDSLKVRVTTFSDCQQETAGINLLPENVLINLGNRRTGMVNIDPQKTGSDLKDDILVALELVEAAGTLQRCFFIIIGIGRAHLL